MVLTSPLKVLRSALKVLRYHLTAAEQIYIYKSNFGVSLLRGCNFFFRLSQSRGPLNIKGKCRGRGINTGRGDLDFGFQYFVV